VDRVDVLRTNPSGPPLIPLTPPESAPSAIVQVQVPVISAPTFADVTGATEPNGAEVCPFDDYGGYTVVDCSFMERSRGGAARYETRFVAVGCGVQHNGLVVFSSAADICSFSLERAGVETGFVASDARVQMLYEQY